jgi:hypothetical protein
MLRPWIKATSMPDANATKRFSQFVDWLAFYGLHMPAEGEVVADYLLDMMAAGASQEEIRAASDAIIDAYARRRCFLDVLPIRAALAMCEAQLSPNRVLN